MKCPFQVGDRVRCDDHYGYGAQVFGMTGTVVWVPSDWSYDMLLSVEWDEYVNGHSCNGRAKDGHGWNVNAHSIELVGQEIIPNLEIGGLL